MVLYHYSGILAHLSLIYSGGFTSPRRVFPNSIPAHVDPPFVFRRTISGTVVYIFTVSPWQTASCPLFLWDNFPVKLFHGTANQRSHSFFDQSMAGFRVEPVRFLPKRKMSPTQVSISGAKSSVCRTDTTTSNSLLEL